MPFKLNNHFSKRQELSKAGAILNFFIMKSGEGHSLVKVIFKIFNLSVLSLVLLLSKY